VGDLVAVAGRHRHALLAASRNFRVAGSNREDRIANRADRLIQAALVNGAVLPTSEEEEALIVALEAFKRQDKSDSFSQLCALEPRLSNITAKAPDVSTSPSTNENRRNVLTSLDQRLDLRKQLTGLLGPRATNPDPLVRSQTALEFAIDFLADPIAQ
jgi:hypothetical protein